MTGRVSGEANGALGVTLAAALLVAGAFATSAADLPAAEPRAFSASAEKAQVRLGESFAYSIEIRHDPTESYALTDKLELEPFAVSGPNCKRDPELQNQDAITRCTMRLALFELGDHDIPEVTLRAQTARGERILRVPSARVTGVSVLDPNAPTENLDLRDISPSVPVMVPSYRLLLWAGGLLGVIGLIVVLVLLWRRLSRRGTVPVPATPPHERFGQLLDALEAEALPGHGRSREFFFRLSEAVREYVGALHQLNALDLTTEEILAALAGREPGICDQDELAFFCRRADLVKFARREPREGDCSEAMAYARELLEQTRPRPEPEGDSSGPAGRSKVEANVGPNVGAA